MDGILVRSLHIHNTHTGYILPPKHENQQCYVIVAPSIHDLYQILVCAHLKLRNVSVLKLLLTTTMKSGSLKWSIFYFFIKLTIMSMSSVSWYHDLHCNNLLLIRYVLIQISAPDISSSQNVSISRLYKVQAEPTVIHHTKTHYYLVVKLWAVYVHWSVNNYNKNRKNVIIFRIVQLFSE